MSNKQCKDKIDNFMYFHANGFVQHYDILYKISFRIRDNPRYSSAASHSIMRNL